MFAADLSLNPGRAATLTADLCVVGGGPAGIITVLEYIRMNPSRSVVVVEYGYGQQPKSNPLDDSITIRNIVNHHRPYECTNKGLGGTSQTWGGRCVMYDDIDFMKRPSVDANCTWDSALFVEVKTFAAISATYFECGEPTFTLHDMPQFQTTRIADHFREGIVTDSNVERWSAPTRFGRRYRRALATSPQVTILEGYEARDFTSPDAEGMVTSLTARHVVTKCHTTIQARYFVLAAGTQETTRILLRNIQLFNRLQDVPAALGKYYQGHVSGKIASVVFNGAADHTDYGFLRSPEGVYMRRRFQFAKEYLLANDLLNTAFWLDNPPYDDPAHGNGAMSFMYLAMLTPILGARLAPPAIAQSITKGKAKNVSRHLWNVVKGVPRSLITPAAIFYRRYCRYRKLPGVFLFNPTNTYALNFHAEQLPVATNRMELGPDGEGLVIHYDLTDADVTSVIRLHETLDDWLRQCNCGKLKYWYSNDELPGVIKKGSKDGIHQIGTTRIGDSPESGVVDRNLKLWGTDNLFVCSSSVFPTSGQANPTFFLGAFAARLADHITQQ